MESLVENLPTKCLSCLLIVFPGLKCVGGCSEEAMVDDPCSSNTCRLLLPAVLLLLWAPVTREWERIRFDWVDARSGSFEAPLLTLTWISIKVYAICWHFDVNPDDKTDPIWTDPQKTETARKPCVIIIIIWYNTIINTPTLQPTLMSQLGSATT